MQEVLQYFSLLALGGTMIYVLVKSDSISRYPFVAILVGGFVVFGLLSSGHILFSEELYTPAYYFSLLALTAAFFLMMMLTQLGGRFVELDMSRLTRQCSDSVGFLYIALWGITALTLALYVMRNGLPPALAFSTSGWDVYAARAEKWTALSEGTQWYRFGLYTLPTVAVVMSFIKKSLQPSKMSSLIFWVNLGVAAPFQLLMAQKGPLLDLVLTLAIADLMINGTGKLFRKIVLLGTFGMALVTLLLWSYLPERSLIDVAVIVPEYLNKRLLGAPASAHAYIMIFFPDYFTHIGVSGLPNPGEIFNFKSLNLSRFLGRWSHGVELENFSHPAFSAMYAGFGWLGMMLSVPIAFAQAIIFQLIFRFVGMSLPAIAVLIVLLRNMMVFSRTGTMMLIGPSEMILIVMVLLVGALQLFIGRAVQPGSRQVGVT